jgi:carbon monoxide dehydrogenase subunit G
MKMEDEIRIDAPRAQVFAALNDPGILKQAIPGCQELEKVSDTEMTATVQAKVGPVKAKFSGKVVLSDINPPEGYTISGEGTGGAAGFAKGSARVTLVEEGDATLLRYAVDADVGGKLAQIGNRLIEGTSKKLAGEFFESFSTLVSSGSTAAPTDTAPAEVAPPAAMSAEPAPAKPAPEVPVAARSVSPWAWATAAVVAALIAIGLIGR